MGHRCVGFKAPASRSQPAADSWLARGRSCRQAPSERPNRRCCPAQRLKSRQTNLRSASVWRGRMIGKLSGVSTRWQLGHREGRCGPSDKQASLVLHTDRSRAGASVTIEARANPRHTYPRRLIGGAAGHSALTTDVLVRFVVPRRFAGFPPVRLSLQSGQTDARLQCRVLWATSSIRISRVMRSCGMEKLAARPAIISDADSIESAISSPRRCSPVAGLHRYAI